MKGEDRTENVTIDDSGFLYPDVPPQRNEGLEYSLIAAQIFTYPYELAIKVRKSKESGKFAFVIARDMHTHIIPIMKTDYHYDTAEKAVGDLEYTLRLIVRVFSDEHINPDTKMITTKVVDWIMLEVHHHRIAKTNNIAPPLILKN